VLLHIGKVRLLRQGDVIIIFSGDSTGLGEPEALGVARELGKSIASVVDPIDGPECSSKPVCS